jgi:hypothetical protein
MDYRFTQCIHVETADGPALVAEVEYKADILDDGEEGWKVGAIYIEDLAAYTGDHQRAWKLLTPGSQPYALALSHIVADCEEDVTREWRDAKDDAGDKYEAIKHAQGW